MLQNGAVTLWNANSSSWGKIEEGKFKVYFEPSGPDVWGNVAITQGNQAHNPIKNPSQLKERFVIRKEGNETCWIHFGASRHELTFLKPDGICGIGVTLYLDVGLNFSSPDTKMPHALPVDFIFARFKDGVSLPRNKNGFHWQHNDYENDYHSSFIIGEMPEADADYSFLVKVDELLRQSLKFWNFNEAEVKGVHVWLEGINAKGSCEIDYVEVLASSILNE